MFFLTRIFLVNAIFFKNTGVLRMQKLNKKMSYELNIGLYFFFSSLIILVTTTSLLYYFVSKNLKADIIENLESTVDLGSRSIDTDAFKRLTHLISSTKKTDEQIKAIEQSVDYKKIHDELNEIRNTKKGLINYVYTLIPTKNPNEARFVVDADVLKLRALNSSDPDISYFGRIYDIKLFPTVQTALTKKIKIVDHEFVYDQEYDVNSVMGFAPIYDKNTHEFLGIIGVDISDRQVSAFLNHMLLTGSIVITVALFTIMLISIFLARSVSRPISKLSEIVKRFSDKTFHERATMDSHIKEISDLIDSFNFMAQTIQTHNDNLLALNLSYERFVPVEFLNFLSKDHITQVQLGDQIQKDMAVMFTDIRSFTTLSESMTPKQTFDFLNGYLQRIGPIIRQHNGFIDKYMGDGIMALFPRTPDDAILAAIEMRKKLIDYNIERVKWRQVEINTGIGIHVGTLMLGTIGEDKRMQGTVISDAVNLASRLESMTKDFGISILISKEVFNRLESPEKYKHRFLGNTNVKGKMESIPLFEIYDSDPDDIIRLKDLTKRDFESGLYYFSEHDYRQAKIHFCSVVSVHTEDKVAALYIRKCQEKLNS